MISGLLGYALAASNERAAKTAVFERLFMAWVLDVQPKETWEQYLVRQRIEADNRAAKTSEMRKTFDEVFDI